MAKKTSSKPGEKSKAAAKKAKPKRATSGKAARSSSARRGAKKKTAKKTSKTKSPLTKAQIKELRELLLEKRRSLVGDMAGIEDQAIGKSRQNGSGDLSNMPTHPADIGSDNYEQEFTLGLLESERSLLQEIDEALERVKKKTFGLCVATGKPIGIARLRARPWAKYCIEYARMLEKGLVRPPEEGEGYQQEAEEGEEETEEEVEPKIQAEEEED